MVQLRRGVLALILCSTAIPASAEPFTLTYSYSNLLDGTLFTVLTNAELRSATEEALGLWSRYAPIDFVEVPDEGPPTSDKPYPADGTPDIRIGHHDGSVFTHAFYPWAGGGLARDVHLRTRYADPFYWGLGDDPSIYAVDILGILVHELGHSLGLFHYDAGPSVMNPTAVAFNGLGTGFLYPIDIQSIRFLYGPGVGWVRPLQDPAPTPEPGTWVLLLAPLIALLARRRGLTPRLRQRAGV